MAFSLGLLLFPFIHMGEACGFRSRVLVSYQVCLMSVHVQSQNSNCMHGMVDTKGEDTSTTASELAVLNYLLFTLCSDF